ncbi:hypothetical protein [Devosia ginsengisoli]|uniref:Uncharacterized protein n=1 Tax=Devosia ginsengisoli TaxID=400770 RepID=A0A5B8LMK1_9HYPH|nr:hypothetical protein [Devosia ginsengisoli]QDZ09458.1 hypothetical protein FPZ08_01080 [Devosia ginsengisoli]
MRLLPVLVVLLPLLTVSTPAVMAQPTGSQCTSIAADAERLACFDAAFAVPAGAVADSVVFQSEQMIPARPSGRQPATITIACANGVLSVAFAFAGNTMSALGRDAGITWQFDLQAARSRTLPVNAENTAILLNNTADSLDFIQSVAGASNLTVRVTPASSRSLNVRYRLDTFADQVAPVRAACGV